MGAEAGIGGGGGRPVVSYDPRNVWMKDDATGIERSIHVASYVPCSGVLGLSAELKTVAELRRRFSRRLRSRDGLDARLEFEGLVDDDGNSIRPRYSHVKEIVRVTQRSSDPSFGPEILKKNGLCYKIMRVISPD